MGLGTGDPILGLRVLRVWGWTLGRAHPSYPQASRAPVRGRGRTGCHRHPASKFSASKERRERPRDAPQPQRSPARKQEPHIHGALLVAEVLAPVDSEAAAPTSSPSCGGWGGFQRRLKLRRGVPLHPACFLDPELTSSLSVQHLGGHADASHSESHQHLSRNEPFGYTRGSSHVARALHTAVNP